MNGGRETWRLVPGVADLLASSHGRIMVAPRWQANARGGARPYGGVPHHGTWDGGRFVYCLRGVNHKVARLVCAAFNGAPPFEGAVCMHVDEDARNNRPDNLRWGTQKENLNAPKFLAYCRSRTGENSPFIKGRRKTA